MSHFDPTMPDPTALRPRPQGWSLEEVAGVVKPQVPGPGETTSGGPAASVGGSGLAGGNAAGWSPTFTL